MSAPQRRYCLCGGAASISSTPGKAAEDIIRMWEEIHIGEGHGPATARQAATARRRSEQDFDTLKEVTFP